MDTRRITGLALIVPPLIAIIGWFAVGFVVLDGVGPDDPQKYIAEMGANSTAITYMMPIITLLFLMAVGGVGYIKKSMEGGPGSYIAGFAWFLIILGSAGQLGEVAATLALAEASDNAATAAAAGAAAIAATNSAVASSMYAAGQAIGAVTTAFSMVGFALFGVGILQQKNFSPLVAGLIIVAGIYTAVMCLIDYENPLIAVGFIGVVVSFIALGVSLLNQKD
ncbi:MAG: hypothetical protein VX701_03010 [Chloroflexota bacterium]|nr:hypothetical protein [Chloroflexota bacterium]